MGHLGYLSGTTIVRMSRPAAADSRRAGGLRRYRLVGPRSARPLRIVIAADVSISMSELTTPRQAALRSFIGWARGNLRRDDQVAALDFSDTADWQLAPAPVARVRLRSLQPAGVAEGGTSVQPALELIAQASEPVYRTSVWFVSDGMFADYPETPESARRLWSRCEVESTALLVPGAGDPVPTQWQRTFPDALALCFDGRNVDATAGAFAEALARCTGQRLVQV